MTLNKRKELEREIRRNDILDAAEKLFLEKGVELVTMADLADTAEYTKKTIYTYFKCKYDIYLALFLRACARNRDKYREVLVKQEKAIDKLRAFGTAYYKLNCISPWYTKLVIYWDQLTGNPDKLDPDLYESLNQDNRNNLEKFTILFRQGIKDGSFREDFDPEQAAEYFLHSLISIYSNSFNTKNDPEKKFLTELEFLLQAFRKNR